MNLQIFTQETKYIKSCVLVFAVSFLLGSSAFSWQIDLSRRVNDFDRTPASLHNPSINVPKVVERVFSSTTTHEIVILNTEKGFVPSNLQLRKGDSYTIHVVNVNPKDKNISFILDSFSQHFGTFYGQVRTFQVKPSDEGIYTFISPEVGAQGRIVVLGNQASPQTNPQIQPNAKPVPTDRNIASEK